MFIIGLELRPQRLWEMRHSIFVMGSMQVVITCDFNADHTTFIQAKSSQ
jgi:Kef-type K+ transport system membrane component KefB